MRCGSCGSAFNALDHLSEEPPASASTPSDTAANNPDVNDDQLLETLNQLAGPGEVRIEDTGIEWLVVDDDPDDEHGLEGTGSIKWFLEGANEKEAGGDDATHAEDAETTEQQVLDENSVLEFGGAAASEPRYDDNTPLPDDFEEQHNYVPQRRSTDIPRAEAPFEQPLEESSEESGPDLDLSEPDEWVDLLEEFSGPPEPGAPESAPAIGDMGEPEPQLAAEPAAAAADRLPLQLEEELSLQADVPDSGATDRGEEASDVASLDIAAEDAAHTAVEAPADAAEPDAVGADGTEITAGSPENDAATDDASIVATQLDELLEAMGSGKFKVGTTQTAEGDDNVADDSAIGGAQAVESPDAEVEDAAPAAATFSDHEDLSVEPQRVYGGPADTDIAEAEPAELAPESSNDAAATAAVAAEADQEPIDATAGADEGAGGESDVIETPSFDETTGEFERAIADAEEEILAAQAGSDGEGEAVSNAPQEEVGDESVVATEDTRSGFRMDLDEDIAALTGNMEIDPEILQAMKDGKLDEAAVDGQGSPLVETIIMEGDYVRGALLGEADDEEEPETAAVADPGSLIDTYISKRSTDSGTPPPPQRMTYVGIALLAVLLLGQVLHGARESLATNPLVARTLGPLYEALGQAVTPDWNIRGWQFEATTGSTDETDSVLTVSSRIANRSQSALPYPLVHISLTDRYEEIVGSRVLSPNEYLPDDGDAGEPVAAGLKFTAVIQIPSPPAEATGFKLNVCYRQSPGRVRCAIEDFLTP